MPPKRRRILQSEDDLAWETSDEAFDEWEKTIHSNAMYRAIVHFVLKYRPGEVIELHKPTLGGYNMVYRVEYTDGSVILRVPYKGTGLLPYYKIMKVTNKRQESYSFPRRKSATK
jgi:hypothetical protein